MVGARGGGSGRTSVHSWVVFVEGLLPLWAARAVGVKRCSRAIFLRCAGGLRAREFLVEVRPGVSRKREEAGLPSPRVGKGGEATALDAIGDGFVGKGGGGPCRWRSEVCEHGRGSFGVVVEEGIELGSRRSERGEGEGFSFNLAGVIFDEKLGAIISRLAVR